VETQRARSRGHGYTLLELLVVLVLIGLSVGLTLPILRMSDDQHSHFADVVERTRALAVKRGELLYLHVDPTGAWTVLSEQGNAPLIRGGLAPSGRPALTLRIAPTGSCAPDVQSLANAPQPPIDPPSCAVTSSW
jgi:prepilin-type N-terminal cleavage/methylation domain-containing protein